MAPLRISPNSPAVDPAALLASGMGVVVHGATAGTARPTEWKQIIWIGSVEPTNANSDDIWYDTTTVLTPNVLMTAGMGVAVHGSASAMARPTGFKQVFWIGSIEPVNIQADDVWDDTTGDLSVGVLPVVTALPAGPYDGMEVDFLADATNGVIWRMRYRAATSRWHYVGGPAMHNEVNTEEIYAASTSYVSLATTGPALTTPFAGDFEIEIGCSMQGSVNGQSLSMSYEIGGTAASANDRVRLIHDTGATLGLYMASRVRRKTLAAATLLNMKYKTDTANNAWWDRRYMKLTPIQSAVV